MHREDLQLPHSFIPFCAFGNSMSAVSERDGNQTLPVCSAFKHVIMKGDLCYQFDITNTTDDKFMVKEGSEGLTLLLDYNTDLHVGKEIQGLSSSTNDNYDDVEDDHTASKRAANIYINTLARFETLVLEPFTQFSIASIKKMTGKPNFFGLPDETKKCQEEQFESCQKRKFLEHLKKNCSCLPWGITPAVALKVIP